MGRILIVDDDPNTRHVLASALRLDHHQTWEAGGVGEARRSLSANDFDVVMTDQRMQDGDSLAVLESAHENDSTTCVILLSNAPVEVALESMSHSVFDFLTKPFQIEEVRATVRRACERTRLLRENALLKDAVARLEGTSEIEGGSGAVPEVRETAIVVRSHASQEIIGETGNGKGGHPTGLTIPFERSFDLTGVLERIEKELIVRTLQSTHGAQAEAARRMGLSRSALAYKLTKYGIRLTEPGIKRRPQRGRPVEA